MGSIEICSVIDVVRGVRICLSCFVSRAARPMNASMATRTPTNTHHHTCPMRNFFPLTAALLYGVLECKIGPRHYNRATYNEDEGKKKAGKEGRGAEARCLFELTSINWRYATATNHTLLRQNIKIKIKIKKTGHDFFIIILCLLLSSGQKGHTKGQHDTQRHDTMVKKGMANFFDGQTI
jgi:hypothetical protein